MLDKKQIELELSETEIQLRKIEEDVRTIDFVFVKDYVNAHRYLSGMVDALKLVLELPVLRD